jgi:hypothetical protein
MKRMLSILHFIGLLFLELLMLRIVRVAGAIVLLAIAYFHAHWSVALCLFFLTARQELIVYLSSRRTA